MTALALGLVLHRSRLQTLEQDAAARSVRLLAMLGERLAFATSEAEVLGAVTEHAAAPAGADGMGVLLEADDIGRVDARLRGALIACLRTGEATSTETPRDARRRATGATFATVTALPMRDASGDTVGALAWAWDDPDVVTERTRSTIDAMRVVCQEHVQRVRGLERRADRAAALYELGQELSVARELDDIVRAVVLNGPRVSGFDVVALATVLPGDRVVRLHGQVGAGGAIDAIDVAVPTPAPTLERLRAGEELTLTSREAIDGTGILRSIVGPDVAALDLVPLRNSASQLIGAVGFASRERAPHPEPGSLRSIADLVAQTVERTHLFEQQSQIVLELQQHTLRPIPEIAGAAIAARYLPAARAVGVGGDWYDVDTVGDDRFVMVVGDVVGHGITAVVDMVEISGLIAAMARNDGDLSRLPGSAAALFEQPKQPLTRMATAVVMRVDTAARTIEYVRLGHPPAVLLAPDGTARLLEEATHPPIGVAAPHGAAAQLTYEPGSVLVLYTDGLVERRGERIDLGLRRLVHAVQATAASDPEAMADAVVARCAHERTTDDIALLVVRLD